MRALIDALFAQIGATSLTDLEFESLTIEEAGVDVETYEALLAILNARESVSNAAERLRYYYLARGVEVGTAETAVSNIYIGSALCD